MLIKTFVAGVYIVKWQAAGRIQLADVFSLAQLIFLEERVGT